jgi:hypothetical protein
MNRQSLTIDALKELARDYLYLAKQEMKGTGGTTPVIILAGARTLAATPHYIPKLQEVAI